MADIDIRIIDIPQDPTPAGTALVIVFDTSATSEDWPWGTPSLTAIEDLTTVGLAIGDPVSGGSANRVLYRDASGNLAVSDGLAYDGSTLGVAGDILLGAWGLGFTSPNGGRVSWQGGTGSLVLNPSNATVIVQGNRRLEIQAQTSTGDYRAMARFGGDIATFTDALWAGDAVVWSCGYNGNHEGLRVANDGAQALVGLYGVAPVARQAVAGTATGTDATLINALVAALKAVGIIS